MNFSGKKHWVHQRLSAIIIIPLLLTTIWLVIKYSISNFSDAISLVSSPLISIVILIYVPFGFFHMNLGIRTILEDYLDSHKRGGYLILNNVVCWFLAIAVILSIIKIYFINL